MNNFAGKTIVIGITGSIAAFKVAGWVSNLVKEEAVVHPVLSANGEKFVSSLTFQALAGQKVHTEVVPENVTDDAMVHISLGQQADLFVIAPATANCMARLAGGFADDLITTTALVTRAPVLVFPAMNPAMYAHPATQENIRKLRKLGYLVVEPDVGEVACRDTGQGRLVEWQDSREVMLKALADQELTGLRVLVTAGPTRESIDPARFISNSSSGKMGYEIAKAARRRGAEVTLVAGVTGLADPYGVKTVKVVSAEEMLTAVREYADTSDIIIKAAAVSDFTPVRVHERKVKKEDGEDSIPLKRTVDILKTLGQTKREGQILVGFAAETDNLIEEGMRKLQEKNLDLIAVNQIGSPSTGFATDTNKLFLVDGQDVEELVLTSKEHTAELLLDSLVRRFLVGQEPETDS